MREGSWNFPFRPSQDLKWNSPYYDSLQKYVVWVLKWFEIFWNSQTENHGQPALLGSCKAGCPCLSIKEFQSIPNYFRIHTRGKTNNDRGRGEIKRNSKALAKERAFLRNFFRGNHEGKIISNFSSGPQIINGRPLSHYRGGATSDNLPRLLIQFVGVAPLLVYDTRILCTHYS